jgi:DNA uptake protein ComE-like DNA-binding protein
MTLPGIDAKSANRIISGRPYVAKDDLESRNIISADEYQRIEGRITAR